MNRNEPSSKHAVKGTHALSGIKVVDLTRVLGGPYATQILGDHGAEIIKVEAASGDEVRGWGPPFERDRSSSIAVILMCGSIASEPGCGGGPIQHLLCTAFWGALCTLVCGLVCVLAAHLPDIFLFLSQPSQRHLSYGEETE